MNQVPAPKKWKFALLIWCFIYPLITLLTLILVPLLDDFYIPLRTFILTIILVPAMAFFYIPFINKKFFNWLRK